MSVISTYLNDSAQTQLNGFVVYMLCKQVCNKHGEKSNRWSLSLRVCAAPPSNVGRVILNSRGRGHGWSQITECSGDFVLTPQQCIQKMGHVSKNTPLKGWFVIPLARLDIDSLCRKFESSSFSHSWDMDGEPKNYKWLCYGRGTARHACQ